MALVTTAEVTAAWADFAALSAGEQSALVDAASAAIEGEADRVLASASRVELHRPGRSRLIRTREWPVTAIARVGADLQTLMTIEHTDASVLRAQVATTTSGVTPNEALTGISLQAGGVATPLAFATYTTLASLATAINATAGWIAITTQGYSSWLTADLSLAIGAQGAKGLTAELEAFTTDLPFVLDDDRRTIHLTIDLPDSYRHPDRTWAGRSSPRQGAIVVSYTAGYAVAAVPADLKRAAIAATRWLHEKLDAVGVVQSESMGAYSYTLGQAVSGGLPGWIADMVAGYRRVEMA